MAGPRAELLNELLGFVFTRLTLASGVLVAMWALWNGYYVAGAGLALALAGFLFLYWRYLTVGGVPEE